MKASSSKKQYARVLTIAGSDSGGGAGIQADLKTFTSLNCFGTSVIAALTAQNTLGVQSVWEVPPEFISTQIDSVLSDIGTDAVKLGMLHSPEVIERVAKKLSHYRAPNIVLDPVMVAKGGHSLLKSEAVEALKLDLFPLATVATPNLPEAERLLGRSITDERSIEEAAMDLLEFGPEAVVLKGGHLEAPTCGDCLVERGKAPVWVRSERVATQNTHGTGCTFSAAIAVHLAQGKTILDAVRAAKRIVTDAIVRGSDYQLGSGHGPLCHFK